MEKWTAYLAVRDSEALVTFQQFLHRGFFCPMLWNPGKILFNDSRILLKILKSGIHAPPIRNSESTTWNPESKSVLDYLTQEARETRERKTESTQGTMGEANRRESNITLKFDKQKQNQSECLFTLIGYLNTIQLFYTNNDSLSDKLSAGITKQIISTC